MLLGSRKVRDTRQHSTMTRADAHSEFYPTERSPSAKDEGIDWLLLLLL